MKLDFRNTNSLRSLHSISDNFACVIAREVSENLPVQLIELTILYTTHVTALCNLQFHV